MRVVLDTNIFLSALISTGGPPYRIYQAWRNGRFELITCTIQLDELRAVSRYPRKRLVLEPHQVGRMINYLQRAIVIDRLPDIHEAADPNDAWLLTLADIGKAD